MGLNFDSARILRPGIPGRDEDSHEERPTSEGSSMP